MILASEICNALMEVRAKTSSKSPKPLSVFWGHHKSPAQWVYPARASQSPDLPPACFVPFIVVVQTHAPPPREPLWRSARGRPPRSGRDRRRETRGRPRGRTYDVPVPAKRAAPLPASSLTPNPTFFPGARSGPTSLQPARTRKDATFQLLAPT